jgi:hypothetical protein
MSNAIQLRDSSDFITFRKNRALYQNYVQLAAKNSVPVGGIPHNEFMAVARANAVYIPAGSLLATIVNTSTCPDCTNDVAYVTTEIVALSCSSTCSGGSSYQPDIYRSTFKATYSS